MLYHIPRLLCDNISTLNFMHYVSFRAMAALMTVLILSIVAGDTCIELAKRLFRSKAREYTPDTHRAKDDMPTMGGLFIIGALCGTMLIWCNLSDPATWLLMSSLILFGGIGFWDDWSKIRQKKGISERHKLYAQIFCAAALVIIWYGMYQPSTAVVLPFFKSHALNLGILAIPWWIFIIVGASNAVNLTDGLDGLAIGSLIPNFATFAIIAYLAGHTGFARYLHIPYAATAELAIIGAALVGASLGFLWFNAYPAQIFMGDVGSLSLGATLGFMAVMTRQELLLAIAGILFVVEALSVMAQVVSYRYFKRRIFRMAPLHHHFELMGWRESKITIRFAIISCIACLCALMTLKIR